jgi:hypothetical protein
VDRMLLVWGWGCGGHFGSEKTGKGSLHRGGEKNSTEGDTGVQWCCSDDGMMRCGSGGAGDDATLVRHGATRQGADMWA